MKLLMRSYRISRKLPDSRHFVELKMPPYRERTLFEYSVGLKFSRTALTVQVGRCSLRARLLPKILSFALFWTSSSCPTAGSSYMLAC